MRIAHLSDLHFTTFFSNNNLQQIELALRYAIEKQADHIAITGDLTDNAVPKDFGILRKLFENLNLLDYNKLSLVIGNHDIFGGVQTAEDIFNFPEKCSKVIYKQQIHSFYSFFPELFGGSINYNSSNVFPFVKKIDNFLLIGLNSISEYSMVSNPFASNGTIDLSQLNTISEILEQYHDEKYRKIVLVHHHFNKMNVTENSPGSFWQKIEKQTMKLRKKKRLLKIFKHFGVELVLHGHYHASTEYSRKGIIFSNAGASLKGPEKGEININFIDISKKNIEVNVINLSSDKLANDSKDLFYKDLISARLLELEMA
jgi:3',5'-cyclic AMP phosphodiesterase CpdA